LELKKLKNSGSLNKKSQKLVEEAYDQLSKFQEEKTYTYNAVNDVLLKLLGKSPFSEEHVTNLSVDYIGEDLLCFRFYCPDSLNFLDLDNPKLVFPIGISFNPFNFDNKVISEKNKLSNPLNFVRAFAQHDDAHAFLIESEMTKVFKQNKIKGRERAIEQVVQSNQNYHVLLNYIETMENSLEKCALELVKFHMGHEDSQVNSWSTAALKLFFENTELVKKEIARVVSRTKDNFAYPDNYRNSPNETDPKKQLSTYIENAFINIFEILKIYDVYNC
jgi:hypothetical protein